MNTLACSITSSSFPATSSVPSLRPLPVPPVASPRLQRTRLPPRRPPAPCTVPHASGRDDAYGADSGGRLVDEDMIVLRKRLHEMQAAERNYEPPSHWMEWEKRYYARYDDDVSRFVGMLQALLMNTRPSVALGLLALVTLSVPTAAGFVLLNLVTCIKAVLAGLHMG